MISPAEMRVLDRNAQYFGVSILELMENAGKAVADVARSEFGAPGKNVLVLCGTGNNGGGGPVGAPPPTEEGRGPGLLPRPPGQIRTPETTPKLPGPTGVEKLGGVQHNEENDH